ncbi:MAG: hypothetical protein ACP5K2_01405 [bacterium]
MDNINSVDTIQMAIAFYALKRAQNIEEDTSKILIQKTLQRTDGSKKDIDKELEKDLFPWLGQNIDIVV